MLCKVLPEHGRVVQGGSPESRESQRRLVLAQQPDRLHVLAEVKHGVRIDLARHLVYPVAHRRHHCRERLRVGGLQIADGSQGQPVTVSPFEQVAVSDQCLSVVDRVAEHLQHRNVDSSVFERLPKWSLLAEGVQHVSEHRVQIPGQPDGGAAAPLLEVALWGGGMLKL